MPADEVAGTRDVPDWERKLHAEHGGMLQPAPRDAKPVMWADIGEPDGSARRHWLNAWAPKAERLAADISRDLRDLAADRAAARIGEPIAAATAMREAAAKLDGLIEALAKAETERDEARAEVERLTALNDEVTRVKWRELGELKAKTDGGEWQWGVRFRGYPEPTTDWDGWTEENIRAYFADVRPAAATIVRRWLGPVEVVSHDGGAP